MNLAQESTQFELYEYIVVYVDDLCIPTESQVQTLTFSRPNTI